MNLFLLAIDEGSGAPLSNEDRMVGLSDGTIVGEATGERWSGGNWDTMSDGMSDSDRERR